MPQGCRLHNVALRGWLIAGLVLLPSALSAQQETEEAKPAVIQDERAAKETPPPKNEAAEAATEQNPPTAETLPPTSSIENKRPAEPPCDARCQAAEQRQKNDLVAQQSMARTAENLIPPAYWQVGLGFLGVILIGVTLFYTRRAAIAAHDAAVQAAHAAQAGADTVAAMRRSERAYVTMSHKPPGLKLPARTGYADFQIEVKNYGRTPATVTNVFLQFAWFGETNPVPDRPVYRTDESREDVGFFLVAQERFFHAERLQIPNKSEGDELWLYGFVDYTDEFGQDHRGGYARVYRHAPVGKNNLFFVDKAGWNYDCLRLPDGGDKPKDNESD